MSSTLRLLTVPLALAALLLAVSSNTQAAPPVPDIDPLAFEDEEFELEEEGGFAEDECETAEEEFEEGLLTASDVEELCAAEAEGDMGAASSSGKCPLRSARARAVERNGKLKVTVGYTSSERVQAILEVRAGSKRIASVQRRLGKSGVVRITKKLSKKEPERVVVRFKARSCGKFQTKSAKVG